MLIFVFAVFVVHVHAQAEIGQDFETIQINLERGMLLQINVEIQECQAGPLPFEEDLYISMPMRQWQRESFVDAGGQSAGQVIRVQDWYLNSGTSRVAITTRTVLIREEGTVTMTLAYLDPDLGQSIFSFNCQLGSSAIVHGYGDEDTPIDTYYTYEAVKAGNLLGRYMEAIGLYHRCSNAEDYFLPGVEFVNGFIILNLAVLDEGTPAERMVFTDTVGNSFVNGTLGFLGEDIIVYRNGSVVVRAGVYNSADQSLITWTNLECTLADSIKFISYKAETDETHPTYADIKDRALKGHYLKTTIFPDNCDVKSGPKELASVYYTVFDQMQLFEAGEIWGPLEYIGLSTYYLNSAGEFQTDVIRIFESNTVTLDYSIFAPGSTNATTAGELQCDLESGSILHSISWERSPVPSYRYLVDAIINNGAIFEIVVDFEGCQMGDFQSNSTYSAILWETYVNNARGDKGYFFGVSFAFVTNPSGGVAWDVATFKVYPSGRVDVNVHLYDFQTGEDVLPNNPGVITCQLNQGGPDGGGSVYFYPYP
jgi:hypothetical protein